MIKQASDDFNLMKDLVADFPNQLIQAITYSQQIKLNAIKQEIRHVVVAGMGGSAIGGILVKQWVADQLTVPMEVIQDYSLPAYVDEHTLLVVISYSGNTDETIQAFRAGLAKQAKVIVMTSGGLLRDLAKQHQLDLIPLPTDRPPRACLDHILIMLLFVLSFYKWINKDWVEQMETAIQALRQHQQRIQTQARAIAQAMQGKMPVIYAAAAYEGVAMRWRQQLNENGKQLCWHHTIPALNHNEIVGWQKKDDRFAVLLLDAYIAHERVKLQKKLTQAIVQEQAGCYWAVKTAQKSYLTDAIELIHLGDWFSLYWAKQKAINPLEVKNIDRVKFGLSQ